MRELIRLLGEDHDYIVVIGGWAPILVYSEAADPHVGSADVDLALDHRRFGEAGYRTIQQLREERGYVKHGRQPFIFHRAVGGIDIELDHLKKDNASAERWRRKPCLQDVHQRKARACDLVFDEPVIVRVEGS